MDYPEKAEHFLSHEQQFHLGFLPTEQSSPLTRDLDQTFAASTVAGIQQLQTVDRNVLEMAQRVLASPEFADFVACGTHTLQEGHKLVFSGCGSTGRLSILLESMWRRYFLDHPGPWAERYGDRVFSIMTGGDHALIRSVEFFEDYAEFGRQQVRDLGMEAGDLLVAITEGGETSSVLGTVDEATQCGGRAFLLFNNPAPLLRERLERCRQALDNPAVTALDLFCGPMAVAGSTRMQATTAEQLVAGAALEEILRRLTGIDTPALDFVEEFRSLLDQLGAPQALEALAKVTEFEAELYRNAGLITYFADDFLLDIFTDTTERSPTFMLPPFRKLDDETSPQSWAFVKNPLFPTPEAWRRCLARAPRCLPWQPEDYKRMGAPESIYQSPPKLNETELMKFTIGSEDSPCRYQGVTNTALLIAVGQSLQDPEFASLEEAFLRHTEPYQQRRRLYIGASTASDAVVVPFQTPPTPLRLLEHLALKLVMNSLSTATMALLGRLTGNWMSWVEVTNKKLLDRGTRLVAELCEVDYRTACLEIFRSVEELASRDPRAERISPVQHTLRRLGR